MPWQRIGQLLPLRITEKELIVYSPDVREIARHELYPSSTVREKSTKTDHRPGRDPRQKYELLHERFAELGAEGVRFLEEIVRTRRYGKDEAARVLNLLATYERADLAQALERAGRYRAFSLGAVERILGAQARPRSGWAAIRSEARTPLEDILQQSSLSPRSTAEYQPLLEKADPANRKTLETERDEFTEVDDDDSST